MPLKLQAWCECLYHLKLSVWERNVVLPWNRRSWFYWPDCCLWRESAWSQPALPPWRTYSTAADTAGGESQTVSPTHRPARPEEDTLCFNNYCLKFSYLHRGGKPFSWKATGHAGVCSSLALTCLDLSQNLHEGGPCLQVLMVAQTWRRVDGGGRRETDRETERHRGHKRKIEVWLFILEAMVLGRWKD